MTAFSSRAYRCATGFSSVLFFVLLLNAVSAHSATYVGATQGVFKVSESGAATYAIPIMVPPGTAGMQPSLALVYNSLSGDGLMGKGWSLSGLSAITRCPRTKATDGVVGSINLNSVDRFCLDGQRLVAVIGTYGANNTEYRTEIESNAKVVSYGAAGTGPASFTVWTKSGQILEFGNSANSRIEAAGSATALVWALNKVSDRNGNSMTVSYYEFTGEYYPSRGVCATGSTLNGVCDDADNYDTIQYPDLNGDAKADLCFRSNGGLKCFIGNGEGAGYGAYISTSICANASTTNGGCDDTDNHYTIRFADFNGDGAQDLVFRSNAGLRVYRLNSAGNNFSLMFSSTVCANGSTTYGTGCDKNFTSIWYPDINADGRADVCYRANEGMKCVLSTGTSFSGYVSTAICANGSTGCNDADNYETIRFADMNGDGKFELVYRSDSGMRAYMLNEAGNGFTTIIAHRIHPVWKLGHHVRS